MKKSPSQKAELGLQPTKAFVAGFQQGMVSESGGSIIEIYIRLKLELFVPFSSLNIGKQSDIRVEFSRYMRLDLIFDHNRRNLGLICNH